MKLQLQNLLILWEALVTVHEPPFASLSPLRILQENKLLLISPMLQHLSANSLLHVVLLQFHKIF